MSECMLPEQDGEKGGSRSWCGRMRALVCRV